ncbi:tetratricopeptide repeat protein [Undibacterium sp. Di24W]|uniref:tetratricopeptide repeat protein n=1 Tax=Undibacterium sp. Di24W TaxID=3413033 RepID=UPI003BF25517
MQNWIKRLLRSKLENASIQNQMGDEFYEKLDYANAEIHYRKALAIKPDYFDALINLGLSLDEQKRYQESEVCFKQAIACKPNSALARFNLGISLKNQYFLTEAEDMLRQAIDIWPVFFQCHNVLGEILLSQNRVDEAIVCFEESIRLSPEYSPAHKNLGDCLMHSRRFDEAKLCFLRCIELTPHYAEAFFRLGFLYLSINDLSNAEEVYRYGIKLKSDFAPAYCNLGLILMKLRKYGEVEYNLKKAIALDSLFVAAYTNLGLFYNEEKRFIEARDCFLNVIAIDPNFANAYSGLGVSLMDTGKIDEAIEKYRKALSLDSSNLVVHSNLLMAVSSHNEIGLNHYQYQSDLKVFAEETHKVAKPYTSWDLITQHKDTGKLRIGFVSGDFHIHPVGFFLESVIAQLNLDKFELFAYANRDYDDALTHRIRPYFKEWRQITRLADDAVAQRIYQDGIHILIDLSGHTADNRLPVFAWKPAPIQVSWLGYFASTGVPGMDYVISDPVAVPPEHHDQFTEAIWYVPNTRLCFTAPENAEKINVSALPALKNGFITVGCFQGMAKLTDEVLALWGKVFQQLPTAKLRLQNKYMALASAKEEMLARLALVGIDADRVELVGAVDREQYLLDHAKVDMILDTFPYTGGTTTCEALWMGVPTLTLNGSTMISRQGASMLTCAGLADWVAEDEDDYLKKAFGFASDLHHLSALRSGLREQVLASPLFDAKLFARNFELALTKMWSSKKSGSGSQ